MSTNKTAVPAKKSNAAEGRSGWRQDPERVQKNILDVASREFARMGLSGARIDRIAAKTSTSKRMIYYYFGDKEGLYRAVLEEAYVRIRSLETQLDLGSLSPTAALTKLVGFTFDYHLDDPALVRLVMVENIHQGRHLKSSKRLAKVNSPAIDVLREIYVRGVASGEFRTGLDPLSLHLTISALSFYNVSNRHTILQGFGLDMSSPDARQRRRDEVIDIVLRTVVK